MCLIIVYVVLAAEFILRLMAVFLPVLLLIPPAVRFGRALRQSSAVRLEQIELVTGQWTAWWWRFGIVAAICFVYPSWFMQLDFLRVIVTEWGWPDRVISVYPYLGILLFVMTGIVTLVYFRFVKPRNII